MRSKRTPKSSSIGTGESAPNGREARAQPPFLLDAENARREAERKYRDIFENAIEGIFQTRPGGGFITANPALAYMLGFESPEELIRARAHTSGGTYYVHPERRVELKRLLDQYDTVKGFEFEAYRKDGTRIWMSDNVRAARDASGKLLYYEGTVEDITERKRAGTRSSAFATLARKLSGARAPLDAGRIIAAAATDLFGWDSCNLDLYDADLDLVYPMLNVDRIDGRQVEVTSVTLERRPTPRSRRVIDHGPQLILRKEPFRFEEDAIPFGDTSRPSASIMSVPVSHASKVIGLLSIQSYTLRAYDDATLKDFQALADHCGEALNRIRAEADLRESEERYRDLIENSREFICTHNLDGLLLSANRAAVEVLGFDPKDYLGKRSFRELLAPEVRDQFDDYLTNIRRDGVASGRMLMQTSSGEHRIWEYYNTLRTEGVATPIVRGMALDITEQRRAEKAMSDLRRELELTMNSMEEGIHRVDLQGNIVFENAAAARMLGWKGTELLGQRGHPTMHHTRQDGTPYPQEECPIYATLRDGVSRHVADEVFWRQDGTSFPVEYTTAPMRSDQDEIVATVVTFRDITDRKRAEAALRESEKRYRELFENGKDAIYVHDLRGAYTSINRAAEILSGYPREEILGKHFWDFVAPEYKKQVRENLCKKLKETGETNYEVEIINRDGARVPVEVSSRLIYQHGVAVGVQGSARNITERKRAQEALLTYSRRLIAAQEAERGRIARELHDQIGQMLTALKLNLHAIQSARDEGEASLLIEDNLKMIDEALEQVRNLSVDIRPLLLDDLGLVTALQWYVDHQAQRTGVRAEFACDSLDADERFSSELETACFRIAQEALTNMVRHAHAKVVRVLLSRNSDYLTLLIEDDGVGFDIKALQG
ncbi:MAG TPA: PAS domain S-box protein, partial [Pyrinomonadaceae bacterium]|nr:PAS domain S-box protein [Pyrinomonadaceae bacterium]